MTPLDEAADQRMGLEEIRCGRRAVDRCRGEHEGRAGELAAGDEAVDRVAIEADQRALGSALVNGERASEASHRAPGTAPPSTESN